MTSNRLFAAHKPMRRKSEIWLVAAMAILMLASASIWASGGVLWRYPKEIRPVLAMMDYPVTEGARYPGCWLSAKSDFANYAPECRRGTTLIWGDSHAARLYTGFAGETAQFTRDGCAPLIGYGDKVCAASNARIAEEIARIKPRRVVIFAAWLNHTDGRDLSERQSDAFRATLRSIHAEEVVVLGPMPIFRPSLPELVYIDWFLLKELPDMMEAQGADYRGVNATLRRVAEESGARFISVYDLLCEKSACITHTPESRASLLSWDYGHLTTAGARYVADLAALN
ncbi:SGNH hydrolase domain-containing protein [Bradyrhizobium sp.]|uniref:SGNH hydrolase domain-containing protein n=1 Tax=Bradyrhizobium sp. TaxID=376 RepID=UPI001D78301C|nr:SGNH hydrolase domain-containing protein [Bradyrhizobium sp.]MBI5321110.1 SGNH/GDSL hydrolase family protein [Bradyrhizobium sp.]